MNALGDLRGSLAAHGLSLDVAQQRSVLIATPVYRDVSPMFTKSAIETTSVLTALGIAHDFQFLIGMSKIHVARNLLADKFLASGLTDLLFVDADMSWNPLDVVRLLATDKPLIGAVGRKKTDKPDSEWHSWCLNLIPGTEENLRQDFSGNIEVLSVGTGFMLINRKVFKVLANAHPEWRRRSLPGDAKTPTTWYTKFFADDDVVDEETGDVDEFGEDISFCLRWRALGGEVWIAPDIELGHHGSHDYRGKVRTFFDLNAA